MKKILTALFLITVFLVPQKAFALEDSRSFQVEQKDFLLQTSSGETISENILVNVGDGLLKIQLSWQGYALPKAQTLNDTVVGEHSIDFATPDKNLIEIAPQATSVAAVNFKLPAEIKPGDYYGSLVLEASGKETVNFTIRVLGTLTEKIALQDIIQKGGQTTLLVANLGNRTTQVSSSVKLSDLLGDIETVTTEPVNVKAGQIITLVASHKNLLPGFYNGEITLKYAEKPTQTSALFSFWVWQEFFLFTLLAIVLLVIVVIFRWKKHA